MSCSSLPPLVRTLNTQQLKDLYDLATVSTEHHGRRLDHGFQHTMVTNKRHTRNQPYSTVHTTSNVTKRIYIQRPYIFCNEYNQK